MSSTTFMKNFKEENLYRRTDERTDNGNRGILFITGRDLSCDQILVWARDKI